MPTYDYLCDACGHQFEHFQSITAAALRDCPECGKRRLRRLIGTGGGIIFKGSGFYQTDYRSDSYKKAATAEKDSKSSGETKTADSKTSGKSTGSKESTKKVAEPAGNRKAG